MTEPKKAESDLLTPQTPAPAPASAAEVLEMLARAIETERDRQKCGVFFSDLAATLDPAHLRSLAQPQPAAGLQASAEAGVEWGHGSQEDGCTWEMGYATREDAIAAGREQAEDYDYEAGFYVARMVPARPADFFNFDAASFLEACEAAADDETADGLSDFQRQVSDLLRDAVRGKEKRNGSYLALLNLHRRVEAAYVAWADEQRLDPGFQWARDPEWVPLAQAQAEGGEA